MFGKEFDELMVKNGLNNLKKIYGKRYTHSVERTMKNYVVTCLNSDRLAFMDLELYLKSHNLRYSMVRDSQHRIYTIPDEQELKWG